MKTNTFVVKLFLFALISTLLLGFSACRPDGSGTTTKPKPTTSTPTKTEKPKVNYPSFNADNAYSFIEKQVNFGKRVPGTPEHKKCAEWLEQTLKGQADEVIVQTAEVKAYNGKKLPMYNIIGSFNPESKNRIMLSAHWDTRPFADQDNEREAEPIDGANDGGSGVGVLLEIAQILKANPLKNVGVDIIFWDVEDYGKGEGYTYCLGSQHWGRVRHKQGYNAQFGILLDMVGAKNAVFYKEGNSVRYARSIVDKVWATAHRIGYSSYFPLRQVAPITDDHLFINQLTNIPTIDIIQYDEYSETGFFPQWHTHADNIDIIDKRTLKAVGQTVVAVVMDEDAK